MKGTHAPAAPRVRYGVDLGLLAAVLALLAIGVAMVFSASFAVAETEFGDDTYFLFRHLIWVSIGLVALVVISHIDYHHWQRVAMPLYVVTLALLVAVLVPGVGSTTYGASRWISLGPILSFQPSEVAKVAVILYLGAWISRVGGDIHKFTFGTIPFTIILAVSAGLVLVEPDLGTTIVLLLTAASVFFVAGANVLHALLGSSVGLVLLINHVMKHDYKVDRIKAFMDPWADPAGIGWHTTQTLIALGSGGIAGLGLGASRQKYFYLPNAHTDSIFAIVGEEIGFVGTALVLLLFLFFAWRGLAIACATRDPFGRALAAGTTLLIGWQSMLNMAVVSNVVPNTGVPLPFLSYGGTSTVITLVAVGMLLSVSRSVDPALRSWRAWLTPVQDLPATELLPERESRVPRLPAPAAPVIIQSDPPSRARREPRRRPRKLIPTRR
jgi:cell division protein FtsW